MNFNCFRFLWVEFQLKHILSLTSYHDIEGALESLPEDMEQTYERIIRLIQGKPKPQRILARKVLMWILYAKRPLLLGELIYAVAMEYDTKSTTKLESIVPKTETVVAVCANLIAVDANDEYYLDSTVRFVHFSVHEFLLQMLVDAQNPSAVARLKIEPQLANDEVARMCLAFLVFCWNEGPDGKIGYRPLVNYAVPSWSSHVRSLVEISKSTMQLLLTFFEFGVFLDSCYSSRTNDDTWIHSYQKPPHTNFSPSTIALIFDLPLVFKHLTEEMKEHRYPDDMYAMHYAARQNSYKAIERLCSQGYRVNELDMDGITPLYYAKTKDVVQLILDKGADVNAQGGIYGSALQATTASLDNREIVELLLEKGADVNVQGGKYGSALQAAATFRDNREVVELLLEKGADVNVQGG